MRLRVTEAIDTPDGVAYAGQAEEVDLVEFTSINDESSVDEVLALAVGETAYFIGGSVERVA